MIKEDLKDIQFADHEGKFVKGLTILYFIQPEALEIAAFAKHPPKQLSIENSDTHNQVAHKKGGRKQKVVADELII